jgi:hypothetical protein
LILLRQIIELGQRLHQCANPLAVIDAMVIEVFCPELAELFVLASYEIAQLRY